jgi:hypothetical protein
MYLLFFRAIWLADRGKCSLDHLLPGQRSLRPYYTANSYITPGVLARPPPPADCDLSSKTYLYQCPVRCSFIPQRFTLPTRCRSPSPFRERKSHSRTEHGYPHPACLNRSLWTIEIASPSGTLHLDASVLCASWACPSNHINQSQLLRVVLCWRLALFYSRWLPHSPLSRLLTLIIHHIVFNLR